ncbi:MAG TPA: VOC family protein [Candidatus Eisenbacteria bacterium]|jgi:predicted 3-demethylubiquinone-9 3-methyltransferase (glyoxalase superfamily)
MQKITACLWFDGEAEEAARFYASIFRNSRVGRIARYGEGGPRPKGSVLTVEFQLDGQKFLALNGGPQFKFTEAVSFIVNCETQKEADRMWDELSAGGEEVQCGWLKDRYGVSWQIVPTILGRMMSDPDPARTERVLQAVLRMKKLDIKALREAYGR